MKRTSESRNAREVVTGLEITVVPADRESPYWLMKLTDAVKLAALDIPSDRTFTVTINTTNKEIHNG